MNNETNLVPVTGVVMPAVNGDEAIKVWDAYEDLKSKIVKDSDIQKIEGKDFLKKSYWRKIATFFNLSVEVVEERKEALGKTFVWHFTCKAIHQPTGRYAIGVGSCDAYEKAVLVDGEYMKKGKVTKWGKTKDGKSFPEEFQWEKATPNSIHNIRATAETRAFNRAVSNLVGGGEVSAEEVVEPVHEVGSAEELATTFQQHKMSEDIGD
jgi:hypothetical protein